MKKLLLGIFLLALVTSPLSAADTLIPLRSVWKYLDNGTDQGTAWRQPAFNDSSWASGRAELGYGDSDETTTISFGGVSSNNNKHITYYFRREFTAPNVATYTQLRLTVKRDDGAVVYLNGNEIFRSFNMPGGDITYATFANFTAENSIDNQSIDFALPLLLPGTNLLAVEIHQESRSSSDVSFDFELVGSQNVAPTITLSSPLNGSRFTVPASVRLNADASDADGNLARVEFYSGTNFLGETFGPYALTVPGLPVGDYAYHAIAVDSLGLRATSTVVNIIVEPSTPPALLGQSPAPGNVSALTRIVVTFSEPVSGVDASDLLINGLPAATVTGAGASYTFAFPQPADGLVLVTWNGAHGIADLETTPRAFDIHAHGTTWQYTLADNVPPTTAAITPAPGATLAQLTRVNVTFSEAVNGVDAADLIINGSPATALTGQGAGPYEFSFPQPAADTVTVAWAPTAGIRDLAAAANTFAGSAWAYTINTNAAAAAGKIVINEIHYHPASENDADEWIELHNRGTNTVNLAGWAFSRGVEFTLPPLTLAPGGYLIVAADTNAFRAANPTVANVTGNWTGRLSNTGEDIELEDAAGNRVDLVNYADQGEWAVRRRATVSGNTNGWEWLAPHDGEGRTLELRNAALDNNTGQNWTSSTADGGTPGWRNTVATTNLPPLILEAAHFPIVPRSSDPITITARLADDQGNPRATLRWRNATTVSPGNFATTTMHDDGAHGDGDAGDGVFGVILPAQNNRTVIEYYLAAQGTDDQGSNDRTWPAPALETNGTPVQAANALIQVDDEEYSGNQPLYRLIMTESDRVTFNGHNRNIETEFNVTFVAVQPASPLAAPGSASAEVRHNASIRYRGAGSRGRNPPTLRLNLRSDAKWQNKSAINLNSQAPHSQVIGGQVSVLVGLPSEYARAVQLRFNGVNLATPAMHNSYAAVEATNGETVGEHLPDDGDGNVYRASIGSHTATLNYLGTSPTAYQNSGYSKTSNKTANDWTDLMALTFALDPATTGDADYVAAVRRNVNVDLWLRYFAMCSIMEYTETSLANGRGDDYGLYRGFSDPRFIILPHDFDTIFNQGDTGGNVNESIYVAANGIVTTMNRFLFHPEFNPLFQAEFRRLLSTTFATNNLFSLIDQHLGDWVSPATITGMKTFIAARNAAVLAQLDPLPTLVRASVTGEPATPTWLDAATLQVAGDGLTHYRFALNGGSYGPETPVATAIGLSGLTDGSYTVSVIGRDAGGTWQSTNAPTLSRTWTVLSTLRRVIFSEILARNTAAVSVGGAFPDIIELYNPRATVVALGGVRIGKSGGAQFEFPAGVTIQAGGYLSIVCDPGLASVPADMILNNRFALDGDGGELLLLDAPANGGAELDRLQYGFQLSDRSIGRDTRGHWTLCVPSFGAPNVLAPASNTAAVRINEWLASGLPPFSTDFIELHNPEPLPVNIGGLYLTDLIYGQPFRHRLAPLSFLAGQSYKVFLADGNPENGPDHLSFNLNSTLGEIGLVRADGSVVDAVIYGAQRDGISQGRVPNGGPGIKFLNPPTPGAPNPVPPTPIPPQLVNLLPLNDTFLWRYEQSGTDLGTTWTAPDFNDSAWPTGNALLAREDFGVSPEPIRTVLTTGTGKITFYFRTRFNVPAGLNVSELQVSYLIDDGAVFHLNGVEAGRFNMPGGNIAFNTQASSSHEASSYETLNLSLANLVPGENVLAVEVHQNGNNSSDVVFGMRLDAVILTNTPTSAGLVLNEILANNQSVTNADGSVSDWIELRNPSNTAVDLAGMSLTDDVTDPRRWVFPQGSVVAANGYLVVLCDAGVPASTNTSATLNTGFGLNASGDEIYLFNQPSTGGELLDAVVFGLQARDLSIGRSPANNTNWIATVPTRGTDNLAAALGDPALLRINEWMANPTSGDDWIELFNGAAQPVALAGFGITDDLNDRFKNRLPALSFIGAGADGFQRFEADNDPDAGANHLSFRLSAGGESLGIFNAAGQAIDSVSFGAQIEGISQGRLPDGSGNILAFPGHATPGDANFLTLADIVINEVLTHSTLPREDAIELHSIGANGIDISGWYLSDAQNRPLKFRIPDGTILPAGGFVVFYENQFNTFNPGTPFSLSSAQGDEVFLSQALAPATLSGYRAAANFGAAAEGVSFGRHLTSIGADFAAMALTTFGEDSATTIEGFRAGNGLANTGPLVGPVIISEIMYHPPDVIAGGITNDNELDEFIELRNLSAEPVALFAGTNSWRLRDAVDFEFPADFTLAGDARIVVVSFDPITNAAALAAFQLRHGIDNSVTLLGPWRGRLANNSENIELYRPDPTNAELGAGNAGQVPFILVDRVRYADTLPWPALADGTVAAPGLSLHRRGSATYGNDPVNWIAAPPSPGASNNPAALIPPAITSFTPPQVLAAGASITLTVQAAGGGTLAYQWRKDGVLIAGATGVSLSLSSFNAASAGTYSVLVANGAGAASASTVISLGAPPSIVRPPANQVVEPGGTATFSVLAAGTEPLAYQWQFSNTDPAAWSPVADGTNAALLLMGVQAGNAGSYRVIASNAYGIATSAVARLSVVFPPVILAQPVGTNILTGQTFVLSVAAGGTEPLRYQWDFTNVDPGAAEPGSWFPIPWGTNAHLVVTNAPLEASGFFRVRVSNVLRTVTSDTVRVEILPPPQAVVVASDSVATEPGANPPADTAVFTFTRNRVTDQPQQIFFTVSGTALPGVDYVALTSPAIIPAGSNSVSIEVVPLDDSQAESNEVVLVTVIAGPDYTPGPSAIAAAVISDDDNQRPVLTFLSPTNGAVLVFPTNVPVAVTATDADGSVTRVEFYGNSFTNLLGTDTNAPFGLTWSTAPAGANTLYAVAYDNLGAVGVGISQFVLNQLPLVALTAPLDGTNFAAGSDIALAASAVDSDGTISFVDFYAGGILLGTDFTSPYRFTWNTVPEGSYSLRAVATDNRGMARSSLPVTITVGQPAPVFADGFAQRMVMQGCSRTVLGTNITFTREPGEPRHASRAGNHSAWLSWTAPASAPVTIDTYGSDFDTVLGVYTGSVVSNLTVIAANDDFNGDTILSAVSFNATAGTTYHFAVDGYGTNGTIVGGNAGRIVLNVDFKNTLPAIVTQPTSLTVPQGTTVTLSANVCGPGTLTYRWRFNGANIPGATNTFLRIAGTQGAASGDYTLVAANASGSVTSIVATLTVQAAPTITAQPQSFTVARGLNAAFVVIASGFPPLTYQWRYNGSNLDRETSSILTLPNVQGRQEGNYSVVVSNQFGITTSSNATLLVDDGLRINRSDLLLSRTNSWRFDASGNNLGTAWRAPEFDDTGWSNGTALFGQETVGVYPWAIQTPLPLNNILTYYFRTKFQLPAIGYTSLEVRAYVDDGAVWYLNGREAARLRIAGNPPVDGVTSTTLASSAPEGVLAVLSLPLTNVLTGENTIAVEVHQQNATSSDVVFGMEFYALVGITNRPTVLPPVITPFGTDVTLTGIGGRDYALEFSTNLVNWSTVATWTNFTGMTNYFDPLPPSPDNRTRFYRGRWLR